MSGNYKKPKLKKVQGGVVWEDGDRPVHGPKPHRPTDTNPGVELPAEETPVTTNGVPEHEP